MTPTPVGMRCPECAPGPTRVQRAARSSGVAADTPVLTYLIMFFCGIVFLGCLGSGMSITGNDLFRSELARQFALAGPLVADGDLWRLVTYSFVHSGILHIGFNMLILWQLGTMLEPAIGRLQFGVIYFVSVLCGALGSLVIDPNVPTVGASGGIFGLMAAAVVILRARGVDPMATGLPLWIGLNLLITFTIPNISVGGHIGGLFGGALAALAIAELPRSMRGLPRVAPVLVAAGIGVLAAAASVAVA
jgi:membrane associated rhomboid family serine protease